MHAIRRKRRRSAFTLMEVLLVMAILVILGSLVSVSYITIQRNSKMNGAKMQIRMLKDALGIYQQDVGNFPADLTALYQRPSDLRNPKKWKGPYLTEQLPTDPWDNPYQYTPQTNEFGLVEAVITSLGPDGQEGTADDISSRDPG